MGRAVERAWVSLDHLEILRGEDIGDRTVVMGLKNSGHIPARILSASVAIRAYTLPDSPVYDDGDFAPPSVLVAGEVSRWEFEAKHTIANQVAEAGQFALRTMIPGDKRAIWIYGRVMYADDLTPN